MAVDDLDEPAVERVAPRVVRAADRRRRRSARSPRPSRVPRCRHVLWNARDRAVVRRARRGSTGRRSCTRGSRRARRAPPRGPATCQTRDQSRSSSRSRNSRDEVALLRDEPSSRTSTQHRSVTVASHPSGASPWSSTSPTSSSASPTPFPSATAVVCGDRRLTYAELDDRANRCRARAARGSASAPATTSGCYLHNVRRAPRGDARLLQAARGADQRQLPLRRRRARVPRRRRGPRRARCASRGARGRASTSPAIVEVARCASPTRRPGVRGRCSPRRRRRATSAPVRRRPLRPLHGRHDRPAEGCGVASGGHLLRRARRREPRRPADRATRRRSARDVLAEPGQRVAPFLAAGRSRPGRVRRAVARAARARERAVVGARHAARRRHGRALRRAARWTWRTCSTSSSASASACSPSSATRAARPLLDDAATRTRTGWDTSSLRLLGSGGSILSGDVKDGLLAALPSVAVVIEAIGSSESPAQAVAVVDRAAVRAVRSRCAFAPKAETMVVDDELRPIPAGSGMVGRLATRGRVPIGYYERSRALGAHVRRDRRRALVAARRHGDDRRRRHRPPARARLAVHQHRRREGVPRRGRGGAEDAPARVRRGRRRRSRTRSGGSGSSRSSRPTDPGTPPTLDDAATRTAGRRLAGYKVPRALHRRRRGPPQPGRQARLRLGRLLLTTDLASVTASDAQYLTPKPLSETQQELGVARRRGRWCRRGRCRRGA